MSDELPTIPTIDVADPYVPDHAEHIVIGALLMSGGQDRDLDAMVFGRIPDESYFGVEEMAAAYAFILKARKEGRPSSFPTVGQFLHATYGEGKRRSYYSGAANMVLVCLGWLQAGRNFARDMATPIVRRHPDHSRGQCRGGAL